MNNTILSSVLLIASAFAGSSRMLAQSCKNNSPLIIQEQGSFAIGGTVTTDKDGHQFHGDHAYVFYQKPVHPHKYPIVLLHGIHQASKTWETTPDGREGFQNIFPKTHDVKAVVALEGGGFFSFPTDEPCPNTEAEEGVEYINFPMSDLNNVDVADIISRWLHEKGMD